MTQRLEFGNGETKLFCLGSIGEGGFDEPIVDAKLLQLQENTTDNKWRLQKNKKVI